MKVGWVVVQGSHLSLVHAISVDTTEATTRVGNTGRLFGASFITERRRPVVAHRDTGGYGLCRRRKGARGPGKRARICGEVGVARRKSQRPDWTPRQMDACICDAPAVSDPPSHVVSSTCVLCC